MVHVYSSALAPFWVTEGELVSLLLSMGSVKAALDRALKIQLWSEVIVCYNRLNLRHKSAEVIQQQIEEKGEMLHVVHLHHTSWDVQVSIVAHPQLAVVAHSPGI